MKQSIANVSRRGAAIVLAVAACGVVSLSTVFACTDSMGPLTISPTGGSGGTVITAGATGLKPGANMRLLYGAPGSDCMSSTKVLVASIPVSSSGTFSGVTARIPRHAKRGPAGVCGMENTPIRNSTGTTHQTFTVV